MPLAGTIIDALAILLGVGLGLATRKDLTEEWQANLRKILGALAVWIALRILWFGFNGSFGQILKQWGILFAALIAGRLVGRMLRLQKGLNRLGRYAKERYVGASGARSPSSGFLACAILYSAAPLAILGPLQEGLAGDARPLLLKAAMDGLAAVAFARAFGWTVALAAVPVVAYQGTLALLGRWWEPFLARQGLVDSVEVALGFQVMCVALVILELKRIDLSDYLPALLLAPLLTWWIG